MPDFRSWRFPRTVPTNWTSKESEGSQREEPWCRLTLERHAVDEAHVVPSTETEWFEYNILGTMYSSYAGVFGGASLNTSIDGNTNILRLRRDLHHAWDQKKLTFVPKQTKDGSGIVLHCLDESDLAAKYHNLPLQGYVRRELLLARLAWILFPVGVYAFLAQERSRMLWVKDEKGILVPKEISAIKCRGVAHSGRLRSTSPKKRKQNEAGVQSNDASNITKQRPSSQSFDSALGSLENLDMEEFSRGRKRLRAGEWG